MLSCKKKVAKVDIDYREIEIIRMAVKMEIMEEQLRKSNKIEFILVQVLFQLVAIVVTFCYHFLPPKEGRTYPTQSLFHITSLFTFIAFR